MSGSGSVAKLPNRSGRLATRCAVDSLMRRAICRRSSWAQPTTLGVLTDKMPVAICWESMKAIARSGDQSGVMLPDGSPPWLASASA